MVLDKTQIEANCSAAAAGDVAALEALLRHYHERFLAFTVNKVGNDGKGRIEPEDILQESYVAVYRSIASFEFRNEDSFYHWVTSIIERRFVDRIRYIRRKKRDTSLEVNDVNSSYNNLLEKCAPQLKTPSVNARRAEATSALMMCISRLPEDYRIVVQRRYIMEEPVSQIASDLGKTESAIRGISTRAIKALTDCLGTASTYLSAREL